MADPRALAGLLDRANQVFSQAGKLGWAFHEERQEQEMLVSAAGWKNHAATFDEFCQVVLGLRDEMKNPPEGFETVVPHLRKAAEIARVIRDSSQNKSGVDFPYYLDFYPQLNSVASDGYQAVKAVTKAERLDDPFAFVDESKASPSHDAGGGSGGNAAGENQNEEQYATACATLQDPRGGGGSKASGKESTARPSERFADSSQIAAFFNAFRDAVQMTKGYLADKASGKPTDWPQQEFDAACGVSTVARSEVVRLTGKPTGWLNGLLDDLQRASRLPVDECLAFARMLDDYEVALYRGLRQARIDVGEPSVMPAGKPATMPAAAAEPATKQDAENESPTGDAVELTTDNEHASTAVLLRVFTNGLSDERFEKAALVIGDESLSTGEKLVKIDAAIRLPATASARQLGQMLGVSKQAILKTEWWKQNRKGEKAEEVGRRETNHQDRAPRIDRPTSPVTDE